MNDHAHDHCARWTEIGHTLALGHEVSANERAFHRDHGGSCLTCALEAGALKALEMQAGARAPDARTRAARIERAIAAARAPRRTRTWLHWATPVLLAAAAVAIVAAWPHKPKEALPVAQAPAPTGLRVGDVIEAATDVRCVPLPDDVHVCLTPGTRAVVAALGPSGKTLRLDHGKAVASLARQPAGSPFSVRTDDSAVTAVGTIFSVERVPGRDVVRVIHGTVLVDRTGQARRVLHAGHAWGDGDERAVSDAERATELAIAAGVTPPPPPAESPAPIAPTPKRPVAAPPPVPTAAALMETARALRAERRGRQAAAVYRTLIRIHPRAPEAFAARVSLGTLQLTTLNDAPGALRSFDSYLATGDAALREEAAFGRVRALRELGRPAAERAAIEEALRLAPDGVYAGALKRRLADMGGSDKP